MRQLMKEAITALAVAVGITTAAQAAEPVAVWDGDFTTATKSGYTLTVKVGELPTEPGALTLWTDSLLIDKTTSYGKGAILIKYSDYTPNEDVDNTALASAWSYNKSLDAGCEANGGVLKTYWGTTVNRTLNTQIGSYSKDTIAVPESGYLILAFNTDTGTAAFITDANKSEWKGGYDSGIKWTGTNRASVYGYAVGGPRNDSPAATMGPCATMTVESVAVFEDYNGLTQAGIEGIMAYQFPSEVREFYATLDGHVDGWSDLYDKWNPKKPYEGFSATDTLIITNAANDHLNMDQDLTALKLKFVSSPDAPELEITTNEGEVSLAIGTYDFSEAESKMTVKYEMTASVVAGKDTVLMWANNPSLTIAEGNKLTVNAEEYDCSLTASKVSNAGTLHFEGGEAGNPIALTGDGNFGVITLDENTYVKHDDKAGNRKYQITGSGASSFYEVTRNDGGSAGMADGSTFENLILVSGATGDATTWLERATLTNVGLDAKGAFKINGFTPTIRSLTGSGTVGKNGTAALTIACTEDANYAGASDLAFTIAEGTALQTLSGAYTGALTVEEDGQVKLTGAAAPSSIAGAGSVTLANGTGTVTLTSDLANFTGTITVDASVTTLNLGTSRPTCDFVFAGTTEVVYTENVADDGVVQQLNVLSGTEPTYKVMGVDGTEKKIEEGTYTPSVTGKAAWYAWEFNGTLASVGQDTAAMGKDNGPFYTDDNEAIYAYSQPWKNLTWPTEFTTAIACTLPTNANVCLVGWGQKSGGFALTAGDVSKNEVKLVYWPSDTQYTVLTTMTVPNASTCEHLYLVTKTADSIKVYLDGTLTAEYKGALTLGLGIQVGTVYQGVGNTGLIRLDVAYSGTNTCKATVNSLRIYKTALGPNAMAELVKEFPYESPNGTFTRALTGAENQWVAADAWTKVGATETYAAPDADSTVNLSAAEDATVTLNLEESTDYEALNLSGEGAITIAAPAANENKISSSGLVKIGADATIQYSAMSLAGTSIEIAKEKTLTIDCSMIDLSQYYTTATIPLTGLVTGEGEIGFEVPEAITGRSTEAVFNESNNTWELQITVEDHPFVYDNGWTWNEQPVAAAAVSNNTANAIVVQSDLEWNIDRSTFAVNAGTLKATQAGTATITVNDGAFDVNGLGNSLYTVVLNGGSLVNNGERIGDANQITAVNLTKDSTVSGLYDFSLQGNASGQYGMTSMNLGEYTLTKTGTNSFALVNTTIYGTGTLYVEEGLLHSSENTVFNDGVLKIGENGTVKNRSGKTLTIAKIVGAGGTLNNEGTVSDFLLKGALNIANAGTYGTITLDAATLNLGGKRGLALAGDGTVNAQLTLVEMAAAEPITLFTTTEGDFTVRLTDYNGNDLAEDTDYTIEGGVVTPVAKPFIYNEGWTWNGGAVEASVVQQATTAAIVVQSGTCEWNIDRDITVNGGTLKATGKTKANAAITVGKDATFDVNGVRDSEWTVVLNGGSLVNNGAAIGYGAKQYASILQTAASYVGGTAEFGYISSGWNANTLNLGGVTLTKTGANTFLLCETTVTNGTLVVEGGTIKTTGNGDVDITKFAADAALQLGAGTTLEIARPLEIAAITADGATINNAKKISNFTLTGSATLTGDGNWGTNTLAQGAVANVGQKRGLVFAGAGAVNVVLTDAEYEAETATLFTLGEGAATAIGTVMYADEDITSKCTISGNQITAIAKGPSWIDPSDTTNMGLYNAWADTYGVTDPATAKKDAFLLNCANTDEAIAGAKADFTLTITMVDGKPVVECPNEEDYNGKVKFLGSTELSSEEGAWHEMADGDNFFKAVLELIPAN